MNCEEKDIYFQCASAVWGALPVVPLAAWQRTPLAVLALSFVGVWHARWHEPQDD